MSCAKHVSDERGEGPALPTRGSLTFTVVREPDGWKIAVGQALKDLHIVVDGVREPRKEDRETTGRKEVWTAPLH